MVVASSMSIYGEGEYVLRRARPPSRPARAPRSSCSRRSWELACPTCGRELAPSAPREAKPLIPTSIYAITKRDHEELCLVTGAAYGIPTVALRFFNVYGPGQALSNPYTGVAAIFASRLLNGRPPIIFEDGEQSRDFIHVSDIVQGLLLALESDSAAGHAVNLGTGRPTTVAQVAQVIAAGLGLDIEPELNQQYRAGDIRHCFADLDACARAARLRGDRSPSRTACATCSSGSQDQEAEDKRRRRHRGAGRPRPGPLARPERSP